MTDQVRRPALLSGIPASQISNARAGGQLHDIKDVLPVAHAWPWWAWGVAAAALLAVGLVCLFLVRARKNRQKHKHPPVLPPDQAALAELEKCRVLARQGDGRQFAITLADVLRRYIEARFQLNPHPAHRDNKGNEKRRHQARTAPDSHVNAQALTTKEFFTRVTSRQGVLPRLLADHADLLSTLLHHCDMAKFACAQPDNEAMQAMVAQAVSFIRATGDDTEKVEGDKG